MQPSTHKPQPLETNKFLEKKINDQSDVKHFREHSRGLKCIKSFIGSLCKQISTTGTSLRHHGFATDGIFDKCSQFIQELAICCDETDLKKGQFAGGSRFGLAAYRDWYDEMTVRCRRFIKDISPTSSEQYRQELAYYLNESFGNRMRIDYGTGHELNFIIFSMGLCNLSLSDNGGDVSMDKPVTETSILEYIKRFGNDILYLFCYKYIRLCRKVQTRFRLEPAGSRGVYNLDDYQFLPFLFGLAQLKPSDHIPVANFYEPAQVEMFRDDYVFFEALDFILNNKRGPFFEHSYTLYNLSGSRTWNNMFRHVEDKYDCEVLSPLPVIQHLLFGKYILCWESTKEA